MHTCMNANTCVHVCEGIPRGTSVLLRFRPLSSWPNECMSVVAVSAPPVPFTQNARLLRAFSPSHTLSLLTIHFHP